jgi:hypothetical protein
VPEVVPFLVRVPETSFQECPFCDVLGRVFYRQHPLGGVLWSYTRRDQGPPARQRSIDCRSTSDVAAADGGLDLYNKIS